MQIFFNVNSLFFIKKEKVFYFFPFQTKEDIFGEEPTEVYPLSEQNKTFFKKTLEIKYLRCCLCVSCILLWLGRSPWTIWCTNQISRETENDTMTHTPYSSESRFRLRFRNPSERNKFHSLVDFLTTPFP